MEVIALKGAPSVGKSTTINIVYQLMLFSGYVQVPGYFQGPLGNPSMYDFLDVLEKEGVLIGVVSMGDYVHLLKTHLDILDKAGCVKSICACTDKPGTIKNVMHYPHHFIDKTLPSVFSDERIVNGLDAATIYKLI